MAGRRTTVRRNRGFYALDFRSKMLFHFTGKGAKSSRDKWHRMGYGSSIRGNDPRVRHYRRHGWVADIPAERVA